MGALLRYYAAGDVAFVGGSIAEIGGHNMLEPAALGKPVVIGPHMSNSRDIMRQMVDNDGALLIHNVQELEAAVGRLFREPQLRDRMGQAGLGLVDSGRGAVRRTLELIEKRLTSTTG
jgi:3-deoxy-D-manno-octulosonic-acid transferase